MAGHVAPRRSIRVLALLALVLGACSSAHKTSSSITSSSGSTRTSVVTTTTTVAHPGPAGPLVAGPPIALPSLPRVTAAEGPDGAVFLAAEEPGVTQPSVVYVVDGNGPVEVAEHVTAGVAALAANPDDLFVADYSHVTAFSRTSGAQVAQWTLPLINSANASNNDLVTIAAAGAKLLVGITQGNTVSVYGITPDSPAGPSFIVSGKSVAFGPDGSIYYERSDDHLVKLSGAGSTVVGPTLANAPNGLGGGVQYVTVVAGGLIWVSEPAGQGIDDHYTEYSTTTLQQVGTYSGTTEQQFVDAGVAGTLVMTGPSGPGTCPQPTAAASSWCVFRITSAQSLIDPVAVGNGILLVGPYPAVVATNASGTANDLVRIS